MKKIIMAFVCLMTIVVLSSCGSDYKKSNLAKNLSPIFTEYSNWADNDLVIEPFKEKMINFFNDAKGKNFASFYDGEIKFDEIVPTPVGHTNNTDSVAVRFKCYETIFIDGVESGNDVFDVKFDVIGKMNKSEAAKLNCDKKYHLDGNIFGFIENIDVEKFTVPSIDMGIILCENLVIM